MEEFADELFGDGFGEYPLLLRPLIGTMIVVKAGAKFLFYFGLPIVLGFIFLGGAIALIIVSIGCLSDKLSKKDENGTRKKSDDESRNRGSVEHRLEAGEIKF